MAIPGYKILRKIDSGGMSTVYLAIQLSVGREVALKVLAPELRDDPTFGDRFFREANILGSLAHPNIVPVYDVGQHEQFYYIAMDFISGPSFKEKIRTGMTLPEAQKITRQILEALNYAHERGYVHQDVKPDNVLFRENGNAVLTDFGIAEAMKTSEEAAGSGSVIGTPHYMSPEQAQGKLTDARSDLYSLGILFYEMLMGEVPYKGEEAVEVAVKHLTAPIPKLPPQYRIFQVFLNKLLAKKPDQRYQTARECIDELTAIEQSIGSDNRMGMTHQQTEPTAMQAYSLLGALLSTMGSVLMLLIKRGLLRLSLTRYIRYLPHKGLYLKAPKKLKKSSEEDLHSPTSESDPVFQNELHAFLNSTEPKQVLGPLKSLLLLLLVAALFGGPAYYVLKPGSSNTSAKTAAVAKKAPEKTAATKTAEKKAAEKKAAEKKAAEEKAAEEKAEAVAETKVEATPEPAKVKLQEQTFSVTIATIPENSDIRILNIAPKYTPGMQLTSGRYDVEVSAKDYKTARQWIEVTPTQQYFTIELVAIPRKRPGDIFSDKLPNSTNGPSMVVIPKGKFIMGDTAAPSPEKAEKNEMPTREVVIDYEFAMSQNEVTKAEYIRFATATNTALSRQIKKIEVDDHPAIGISYRDAINYTQWLSNLTGKTYRLPTEAEWEYAARADSPDDFWWGNDKPGDMANCRGGCDSEWTAGFRLSGAPVGSFMPNPFKLYDMNGNAEEWVMDCYAESYEGHPTDGSAFNKDRCSQRLLRGGSFRDSSKSLRNSARKPVSSRGSKASGFRVVRELD